MLNKTGMHLAIEMKKTERALILLRETNGLLSYKHYILYVLREKLVITKVKEWKCKTTCHTMLFIVPFSIK